MSVAAVRVSLRIASSASTPSDGSQVAQIVWGRKAAAHLVEHYVRLMDENHLLAPTVGLQDGIVEGASVLVDETGTLLPRAIVQMMASVPPSTPPTPPTTPPSPPPPPPAVAGANFVPRAIDWNPLNGAWVEGWAMGLLGGCSVLLACLAFSLGRRSKRRQYEKTSSRDDREGSWQAQRVRYAPSDEELGFSDPMQREAPAGGGGGGGGGAVAEDEEGSTVASLFQGSVRRAAAVEIQGAVRRKLHAGAKPRLMEGWRDRLPQPRRLPQPSGHAAECIQKAARSKLARRKAALMRRASTEGQELHASHAATDRGELVSRAGRVSRVSRASAAQNVHV